MAKITYTPIKLPAYARRNLLKLADGLSGQKPPPQFDMGKYIQMTNEDAAYKILGLDPDRDYLDEAVLTPEVYTAPECGTTACAAGHGPFYGIRKKGPETWTTYIDRVFLPGWVWREDTNNAWYWCFSDQWEFVDNTAKGAAKRIYTLLEKGLPDNWGEQMNGDAPRSYTRQKRPA